MSAPECFSRQNCLVVFYSEMAFENYFEIKEISQKTYCTIEDVDKIRHELDKKIILLTVLSEMAIESFLNDYAAKCLGDDTYFDTYDGMPLLNKLIFICKFLLNKEIEKDGEVYGHIKYLIKKRNDYVHNKSLSLNIDKIDLTNIEYCPFDIDNFDKRIEYDIKMFRLYCKEIYDEAKKIIRSIVHLAKMFENKDKNSHAYSSFFGYEVCSYDKRITKADIMKEFKKIIG